MRNLSVLKLIMASLIACVISCQVADAQTVYKVKHAANDTSVHRPKVGVVMSGGGAKGFAHIRALKAIEEAGIPIDYIAGTSMGSIIGGLYAVGYDPDMMEELTTHQDWGLIILDKVPRRFYSLDERFYKRNYWFQLPIVDGKIKISQSIVDGVYVNMLLTRLTLPAYKERDFNKLSVPFFCVATDMTTADPVIWESGSMARAIRSSMSIPLLFAPVEKEEKLLCDGGLLNNFPVRLMREKGADIIIGIDLENEYLEKEKLDNSLKILERLIAVVSQHESNKAREDCDILIRPDIGKANMLSFSDFSPILKCGEEAGAAHKDELEALADSLQKIEPFTINRPHVQPMDSIYIDAVAVEGVGDNDIHAIHSYFDDLHLPAMIAIDDIEEIIVQNYSTGYYSDIWYEVRKEDVRNILVMHCKASSYQNVGLTAHYDNNYKIHLLLNYSTMWVSKTYKRRSLKLDLNIAEFPYLKVNYAKHIDNVSRCGAELYSMLMKFNLYNQYNSVCDVYSLQENDLKLFLQFVPNLNQQFSLGAVASYSQFKGKLADYNDYTDILSFLGWNSAYPYAFYSHLYARYFFNNEDDADFVRSGWNVDVQAKCILYGLTMKTLMDAGGYKYEPQLLLTADINKAFPIGKKQSIRVGFVGVMPLWGAKNCGSIESLYEPILGGQSRMKYKDNFIPFTGFPFATTNFDQSEDEVSQLYSIQCVSFIKSSWYWNFFKGLYTQVNCDFGYLAYNWDEWFNGKSFAMGAGLTVGYKTPIGPIEIQLSKSNKFEKPVLYINLGFWF